MKHVKILGLAAIAVLALTALVGVASASAFTKFNAESAPVTLTGTQKKTATFTTSAGTISCTGGSFMGELATTSSATAKTAFSYSGCKFLGFINVTVNANECEYEFLASGSANVVGCGSKGTNKITFEAAGCQVSVGAQTGLTSVSYENVGKTTTRTVTVKPAITNIVYSTTSGCPGGARTNETGGKYEGGETEVKGFKGKEGTTQEGIFMS